MRWYVYLALPLVLGCSSSEVASGTGVRGVVTFDRATLEVPAGAVSTPTTIRIGPATVSGADVAYRIEPTALHFVTPAHLTITGVTANARVIETTTSGDVPLAMAWTNGSAHVDLSQLGVVYVSSADGGGEDAGSPADAGDAGPDDAAPSDGSDAGDGGALSCAWRWGDLPTCGYQPWQTDVPQLYYVNPINRGIPINDPKGEVALVSEGVNALFTVKPLFLTKTGPQTYTDPSNTGWATVTVAGGVMTLTASGSRSYSGTPPCNPVPTKIQTQCSGSIPEPPPAP